MSLPSSVHLVTHPLAQVQMRGLREATADTATFRASLNRLAALLLVDATRDLKTKPVTIQTPLADAVVSEWQRPLVLVPVLRAGLGLLDGMLPLAPGAVVAHVGIARNEERAQPEPYYAKLPAVLTEADVLVVDPMLATGGSAVETFHQLKAAGATRLRFLCVVSCPEGIEALTAAHPDVEIFTAAIDEGLNEQFYIVPGLGDAGDRYFGT